MRSLLLALILCFSIISADEPPQSPIPAGAVVITVIWAAVVTAIIIVVKQDLDSQEIKEAVKVPGPYIFSARF